MSLPVTIRIGDEPCAIGFTYDITHLGKDGYHLVAGNYFITIRYSGHVISTDVIMKHFSQK
jgi:hypothetical protein